MRGKRDGATGSAFATLTAQGQARRLRPLAVAALESYGIHAAKLRLLRHFENTTYRVDVQPSNDFPPPVGPYAPNRFLLRVHSPSYQTAATIHSECLWLQTLRQEVQLSVPDPVKTRDGQFCPTISVPGVPSPRLCSLLRWMTGHHCYRSLSPEHVTRLGRLMARLHLHAQQWKPPVAFQRRRWDWDGLFGMEGGFGVPSSEAWTLLPEPYYTPLRRMADELADTMQALGSGPEVFGLIHSDLSLSNVLFGGGEARAIDFDDCGFGYWLYDMAIPLRRWRWATEWPMIRQAFLIGYTEMQPLPTGLWRHLDTFMAGRGVITSLWAVGKAKDHSGLRRDLTSWLEAALRFIAQYNQTKH